VAEVISGKEMKEVEIKEKILKFLKNFEIIPIDFEISVLTGEIRRDYNIGIADVASNVVFSWHKLNCPYSFDTLP